VAGRHINKRATPAGEAAWPGRWEDVAGGSHLPRPRVGSGARRSGAYECSAA
jgi:hypothetical protein